MIHANHLTPAVVGAALSHKGYPFFQRGDYNLNILGIRAPHKLDEFNCTLVVTYMVDGIWFGHVLRATTYPGSYFLTNPMNPNGVACIREGYYPHVWALGFHQHKAAQPGMRQIGSFTVYYDNDRDNILELDPKSARKALNSGFNCHASQDNPKRNYNNGAGCIVTACSYQAPEYQELFGKDGVVAKASAIWGNKHSFALISESDIQPYI
jgi:hypothetical protein